MRIIVRIVGVAFALAGALALVPAIILLNQRLQIVRPKWGIFDVGINEMVLSDSAAATLSGVLAVTLIGVGVTLFRRRP